MDMTEKLGTLPPKFGYINDVLDDARWLILMELERHGALDDGKKQYPREITLRIRIGESPTRLPVESEDTIRIGKLYERPTHEYSSKGDMGLPDWYFTNPLEYWEKEATVDYLQVKPDLL